MAILSAGQADATSPARSGKAACPAATVRAEAVRQQKGTDSMATSLRDKIAAD